MSLPLFTSLRGDQRAWLNGDLVAGLTVWAVLVPESLAYATIAFGNADAVRNALRAEATRPGTRAVVLDGETMPFVDVTAVRMLVELTDTLDAAGVRFALAHDLGQVRDVMGLEPGAAAVPTYRSVEAAVQAMGG